jgi:hypothetical protein
MTTTTGINVRHLTGCTRPALEAAPSRYEGWLSWSCPECGRYVIAAEGAQPEAAKVPAEAAVGQPRGRNALSNYRCREHGAPVNWRGRGCPQCDKARTRKPKPKPRDTTEERER